MYYFIKGKIVKKDIASIVVENNGVGYVMYTSESSLNSVGTAGDSVTMYTYLHVREDIFDLYGFSTLEEKEMFLKLLTVTGVGPKAALAILSVTTPAKFALAVITDDVKTITKAQGVGPKLAQRVILELKDKLKNEDLDIDDLGNDVPDSSGGSASEALSALVVLGYNPNDAKRALVGVDTSLGVEEMIKKALINLMM